VGAGAVAVSLLIGSGQVALDALYVLLGTEVALIYAAQLSSIRSAQLGQRLDRKMSVEIVAGASVIAVVGYILISELRRHESNVGSSSWWLLLGLAGVGVLLGLAVRRSAEFLLEEMDDQRLQRRVAPLVGQQDQVTTGT
jgi:hypothetical protein